MKHNNTFDGILIQNENKFSSKVPCKFIINENEILYKTLSYQDKLSSREFIITRGGAGKRYLFFEHPKLENNSFYINISNELISTLKVLNNTYAKKLASKIQKHQYFNFFSLIGIILFLIIIFSGSGNFSNFMLKHMPTGVEYKIGDFIAKNTLTNNKKILNPVINNDLKLLISPLSENLDKKLKIHISKDMEVNAYALPGGHIVFNLGLLLKIDNIEELLAISAHELAHISQNHHVKSLFRSTSLFVIFGAILGDLSGLIAIVADNIHFLIGQSYSRDHELEADKIAFKNLVSANISPLGLISFFEKMIKIRSDSNNKTSIDNFINQYNFTKSHPDEKKRIRTIELLYDKLDASKIKSFKRIKYNYNHFKKLLRKSLQEV